VAVAASSTTIATTTTAEPYSGAYGPLTGAPISSDREEAPALVIKIGNNDGKSRPQTGLLEADVIYEELVEGLKTRFFAVFHSQVPELIGPVRSGRSSDVHLFAGLSKPMFGYSGGNAIVLRELRQARDAGLMVDVGALRLESAYIRSEDRDAPDNLYVVPADIPETSAGDSERSVHLWRIAGCVGNGGRWRRCRLSEHLRAPFHPCLGHRIQRMGASPGRHSADFDG